MKLWKIGAVAIGAFVIVWLVKYLMTPAPGTKMPDQGREHVSQEQIAKFAYNSNPPTTGPHDPDWIRPGVYTEPQNKGKLVHSLEHGYIIVHYACTINSKSEILNSKQIQNSNSQTNATQSAINNTDECKSLVAQLEDVVREKKLKKLILTPDPTIDTAIALTAWTYIDTMDEFDAARIGKFIDYHRDQGPEKTME